MASPVDPVPTVVETAADAPRSRAVRQRPGGSAATRRSRYRVPALAVAFGAAALWWLGWHSPVTLVEHVVVDSPRGISDQSIRLASGISASDHVPSVDAEAVTEAIMAAIPAVGEVDVERSLPDTIRLVVTARTPFAAVPSGAGFIVMDAEGVVFDRVKRVKGLAVVRAGSPEDRETARKLLLAVPDALRKRITRVTARSRDDITLDLRGGSSVRWGSVEDSALKARVLAGLMAVDAARYDVSAPLLPTTAGSSVSAVS